MLHNINWSSVFEPGNTNAFISNEIVVKNIDMRALWDNLIDTRKWQDYYSEAKNIVVEDGETSLLNFGSRFTFETLGNAVRAEVMDFVAPSEESPVARIGWRGMPSDQQGDNNVLYAYQSFLVEPLSNGSTRILLQESQSGEVARKQASMKPNPVITAHQTWIENLAEVSKK
ncbi:SRPBCC domain-containing protein [Furfurilactobacillus sp. WILCCON 0119]